MLDRVTETSYTITNAPTNTKYVVQALSYTAISDNVNPEGTNQVKNNEVIDTKDNSIEKENNNYIYYVIYGIGLVTIIGGVILITTKNKRRKN